MWSYLSFTALLDYTVEIQVPVHNVPVQTNKPTFLLSAHLVWQVNS